MEQGSKIIFVCHQPNLSSWPTSCAGLPHKYINQLQLVITTTITTYIFEE